MPKGCPGKYLFINCIDGVAHDMIRCHKSVLCLPVCCSQQHQNGNVILMKLTSLTKWWHSVLRECIPVPQSPTPVSTWWPVNTLHNCQLYAKDEILVGINQMRLLDLKCIIRSCFNMVQFNTTIVYNITVRFKYNKHTCVCIYIYIYDM